jgi:hypothetical protein
VDIFRRGWEKLFPLSLRGAQEIASIIAWRNVATKAPEPTQVINDASALMGLTPLAFRATLDQIVEDPYTQFIVNIWW